MKEIRLFRGKVTIVDDDDYEELKRWTWLYSSKGYVVRKKTFKVNGKWKSEYVAMHRTVSKAKKNTIVYHINGNTLDNRKENLTQSPYKKNTSGAKGVCIKRCKNKKGEIVPRIIARISVNKKQIYLGEFKTVESAAKAYNEAALKYFGEFAKLNQVA